MSELIRVRLEIPAAHRFLNILSGCISELLIRVDPIAERDSVTYQIQLAAQEVCTNIVDHAYEAVTGGRIEILIEVDESVPMMNITFTDSGAPYETVIPEILEIEDPSEGGMGLFLIRQLVDRVDYQRQGTCNIWMISKKLG